MSFDFTTPQSLPDEEVQPLSPTLSPGPPPLRIHHFMLCAGVAACQLTLWHYSMPAVLLQQIPIVAIALNAVYEVSSAIGFTLAVLSIYWHVKGGAGLVQPGQWLLLRYLIPTVPAYAIMLLMKASGFNWSGALTGFDGTLLWLLARAWYFTIFTAIPCAFFTYCAYVVADTRPWRWLFVVYAISSVFTAAGFSHVLLAYFSVPIKLAIAVPILVVSGVKIAVECWTMTDDIASRRPRYWPHWAGLELAIIGQAFNILGALLTLVGWP